ncbi:unnamed protein product [Cuscuta campestris]|uniref:Uncharacterized protein n=1 Tax=Cuscuta campestris TaxID=132261 RepID=A0A484LVX1_9ASTE|nr:unnamed protein product [Cuscuta campestris]
MMSLLIPVSAHFGAQYSVCSDIHEAINQTMNSGSFPCRGYGGGGWGGSAVARGGVAGGGGGWSAAKEEAGSAAKERSTAKGNWPARTDRRRVGDRISCSDDSSSRDSTYSSSTGYYSSYSVPGHVPNSSVPELEPVNQVPGQVGEIGPITADRLGMDSPTEVARLKKKNEEMALILKSQLDELARLSKMAGSMKTEISQLKEENCRLLDEISGVKQEMAQKEEDFLGLTGAWVKENKAEAARVMTAGPEATMESFRLLYQEPEGKKLITAIGSLDSSVVRRKTGLPLTGS